MAQPLEANSPPFCVALFGTNNKFKHTDVEQRWSWLEREFLKVGLKIDGYSADGDGKLLKAMCIRTFSVGAQSKWPWFHSSLSNDDQVMIQDSIHLLVKL